MLAGKTGAENCYDDCCSVQPENEALSPGSPALTVVNVYRQ